MILPLIGYAARPGEFEASATWIKVLNIEPGRVVAARGILELRFQFLAAIVTRDTWHGYPRNTKWSVQLYNTQSHPLAVRKHFFPANNRSVVVHRRFLLPVVRWRKKFWHGEEDAKSNFIEKVSGPSLKEQR